MASKISRRKFLAGGAAVASAAVLAGCQPGVTRWVVLEPYVRPPEEQLDGVPTWYASTCRQCTAGCGIIVRIINGRALKIEGNPEQPLNHGKLCARGQAGLQWLYNPDRLTNPMQTVKRGSRDFARVPWDSALGVLAQKIQEAGSAVAVLGTPTMSGHEFDLLTRLTKAIGAPAPLIWDLRITLDGQADLVATGEQIFGQGGLPAYNVGEADVVYSFGADFLGTWVTPTRYGIEYGNFRSQPKGLRGYLAHFEPHMSLTAAKADQWVPLHTGTEGLVAQALARIMADQKLGEAARQSRAAAIAGNVDVNAAATAAAIPVEALTRLARVFAEAAHPVAIPGNSLAGRDAVAAVQALNTIVDGSIILSPDVPDGLAWPAPASYADMLKLIEQMRSGAVQVLLVYGANPVYELPDKAGFLDALGNVGFVATTSPVVNEMAANSNLVLPDRTYLESWGYAVVQPNFGLPIVGSLQPVVQPLNDVRASGDVLIALAKNIPAAASAFPWSDEVAFLKETVAGFPTGAAEGSGADALWASFLQHGGWWPAQAPAQPAVTAKAPNVTVTPPQSTADASQYPYNFYAFAPILLDTGRGANIPWLQGSPEPLTSIAWQTWAAIHPSMAESLGVKKGDVVRVSTPDGEIEAEVYVTPAVRPDTIAIPTGQGHTNYGRYADNRGANPMNLLGASETTWAATRCRVTPTGKRANVATLESTEGVEVGFFNSGFPGE